MELADVRCEDWDDFSPWVSVYEAGYDGTKFLGHQAPLLRFHYPVGEEPTLPEFDLNPREEFQTMRGFGASLTEACTMNLMKMPRAARRKVLENIFSARGGAGFNVVRLPMGATDFADASLGSYTYNDTKNNEPDPQFQHFDLSRDEKSIAILREARQINPELEVMISPWSPPAWMKTSGRLNTGHLKPEHYQDFANYFVKVIRNFRRRGVPVQSLTIENEPFYGAENYPSMEMSVEEQSRFIGQYLGPTLAKRNLASVKIFGLDHNWDLSEMAHAVLEDPAAGPYVHGVAYHCYSGVPQSMSDTIRKYPAKEVFQTECTNVGVMEEGDPGFDFHWWLENQSVGTAEQGTTGTLGWNLCLDEKFGPQNGGCDNCRGLVTINNSRAEPKVTYNPEFHALAQVSRAVRKNAKRIGLNGRIPGVNAVAFHNPLGGYVFVAQNMNPLAVKFRLRTPSGRALDYEVAASSAVTFSW